MKENSVEFQQFRNAMVPNRESSYFKALSLAKILQFDGMDLLSNCIKINPHERFSAEKALNHQFFDEVRGIFNHEKINCNNICNFYPQSKFLTNCHLKNYLKCLKEKEVKKNKFFFY